MTFTYSIRGNRDFCAWHSGGYCPATGNVPIQIAFFFNTDSDCSCPPMGLGTLSTSTPPGARQSRGLASLAGLSAHEISETRTDPWPFRGWYDSSGADNADKVVPVAAVDGSNFFSYSNIRGRYCYSYCYCYCYSYSYSYSCCCCCCCGGGGCCCHCCCGSVLGREGSGMVPQALTPWARTVTDTSKGSSLTRPWLATRDISTKDSL